MTATRAEALRRMAAFQPLMGRAYAARRNFDLGAASTVSRLSAHLRHRLVTEPEVIAAALSAHGPDAAKFIDEVVWRSYFKGWMELRPAIWRDYADGVMSDIAALTPAGRQSLQAVMAGESGIACIDLWARELTGTGYLHNHARMWFASIWVFALGLPWRLGADFFLRHLLDGDAASNTLAWRWVAGLHTPGKSYHATADNIATFTEGRVTPTAAEIVARHPAPSGPLPPHRVLRPAMPPQDRPTLLLLTGEDCAPQDFDLTALDLRGTLALTGAHLRSALPVAPDVTRFEAAALANTMTRLGRAGPIRAAGDPEEMIAAARAVGAVQIATPYLPQGPLCDWMQRAAPRLALAGITLTEWRRPWDAMIWPDCTAGFFKVRQKIPEYLTKAGLTAEKQSQRLAT